MSSDSPECQDAIADLVTALDDLIAEIERLDNPCDEGIGESNKVLDRAREVLRNWAGKGRADR